MQGYQQLLAAVELDASGAEVVQKAQALAARFGARLCVAHVVEYLPVEAGEGMISAPVNLMQEILDQALERLHLLGGRYGIPATDLRLLNGPVVAEILALAEKIGADLIVTGHHPRRGLMALFNHTGEDVLVRAPCDLLAVRLR